MKNKIKKLKLPLNKMTGDEKNYTAVLLEDVNSNMKAFWEVISSTQDDVRGLKKDVEGLKEKGDATWDLLQDVKEKGDATWDLLQDVKEKGDATFEQVGIMTEKINGVENRLDSIEFKMDDLIKEVSFIKEELKLLKITISEKADKEKIKILEFKITRIESHLKLV